MRRWIAMAAVCSLAVITPAVAAAQQPPAAPPCPCPPDPPPPPWSGSIGAGLALTRGNTDTTNINISFDLASKPKEVNVFKAEGLYLRGTQNGVDSVDRTQLKGRGERHFSERSYLFAQLDYVRDTFKDIDYLISPTVGLGRLLVDNTRLTFAVDGGLGLVWEKNRDFDVDLTGAVMADEKLAYKLSTTATITHSFEALWKMNDFADALYTFRAGIAANMTRRSQLKVELIDTVKTRPPSDLVKDNDVALVCAIVYKF